jgi:hypothetical protein
VDSTRSGFFPAQYVALVEEPELELVSEPELAPGVDEGFMAVALYRYTSP